MHLRHEPILLPMMRCSPMTLAILILQSATRARLRLLQQQHLAQFVLIAGQLPSSRPSRLDRVNADLTLLAAKWIGLYQPARFPTPSVLASIAEAAPQRRRGRPEGAKPSNAARVITGHRKYCRSIHRSIFRSPQTGYSHRSKG